MILRDLLSIVFEKQNTRIVSRCLTPLDEDHAGDLLKYSQYLDKEVLEVYCSEMDKRVLCIKVEY